MSHQEVFEIPNGWADKAWCDNDTYLQMHQQALDDPEGFWGEHGKRIDWIKPYTQVKDTSYDGDVHIRWFHDGTLNASAKPRSSGKVMTRRMRRTSATVNFTPKSASLPTS